MTLICITLSVFWRPQRVQVLQKGPLMSNNHSNNLEHEIVEGIVIREATAADRAALTHLAELDSSRAPAAPVLIAESGGELRAAISTVDGQLIADPWHVTADLVEVLGIRAGLRPHLNGSRLRSLGRSRWGRKARQRAPRPSSPSVPGLPAM
jgi:hypothetical protein